MSGNGQADAKRVKVEEGDDDEQARRLQHRRTEAERRQRINTSLQVLRTTMGVGPRTERSEVLDLTVKHIQKLEATVTKLQSQVDKLLEAKRSSSSHSPFDISSESMHLDLASSSGLDDLGSFNVLDLVPSAAAPVNDLVPAHSSTVSSSQTVARLTGTAAVDGPPPPCPHRVNEIVHFSLYNQRPLSSLTLPDNIGLAYLSSRPTILDVNDSFLRIINMPRSSVVGQSPRYMYQTMPDARSFRTLKIGLVGGKRHTVRTIERVVPHGTNETIWIRKTVRRHGAIPPSGSGPPILYGMLIIEVLPKAQSAARLLDDAADFESGVSDPLCMQKLLPRDWRVGDLSELKEATCDCENQPQPQETTPE
eukprot:m.48932 g.48932  ORF g.48932 m.48932 type:complete len:365 (+) comp13333_c0_seq1:88-1182(+)